MSALTDSLQLDLAPDVPDYAPGMTRSAARALLARKLPAAGAAKRYDPHEFRDPHSGQWSISGSPDFSSLLPGVGPDDDLSLREAPKLRTEIHRAFNVTTSSGLSTEINDDLSRIHLDADGHIVIQASGEIRNGSGKIVGSFRRILHPESGVVHNDTFALAKSEQGAGFAQRFSAHAESALAKLGFRKATVSASGVGGYAWAKRYGWDPSKPTAAGDVPDRLRSIAPHYPLDAGDKAKVSSWLRAFQQPDQSKWPTPAEVANFGKGKYYGLSGSREIWPGKEIMLDSAWSGVRNLAPAKSRPRKDFDPHQLRDPHTGEWIGDGGLGSIAHRLEQAAAKQEALDATPAKLKRAPNGHSGDYTGESLAGPPGMGSVRALSEYEGVEYVDTNGDLRHGDLSDPKSAHRVAEIDKTMNASRLTHDIRVERAIQYGFAVFGKEAWYGDVVDQSEPDFDVQDEQWARWEAGVRPNLTGLRWRERGYSSTSADPAVVEDFGKRWPAANSELEGEPVIMRILVPKGTGAVQLAEMGHAAEILLQRDLEFEIIADHGVDKGFRRIDVRTVTG